MNSENSQRIVDTPDNFSMRPEYSWSFIDPRPIILYLSKFDEYIVYWNGVVMTHAQAFCIAMEYLKIYPTPEMKHALETTFARLYWLGAFESNAWDDIVKNKLSYSVQKKALKFHLAKLFENKQPKDIFSWFNYSRARIEEKS